MERADVIIIGAGLLGCFAARSLAALDLRTVVLEAREDVCTGISKANTGIIYSGCDTRPGTLKTELCVKGSLDFPRLCRELDVPFRPCGSLMVSFGPVGDETLRKKYRQGLENGVPGLALLDREEVLEKEPVLSPGVTLGLWAPTAGTVDPWALGIAAFENAAANGVAFRFREEVLSLRRADGGFLVETVRGSYAAKAVLNCAGAMADKVREFTEKPFVRIFPNGADYLVLDRNVPGCPSHILFQETETGKGVTLVPTVDGNLLVGPTEREGCSGATTAQGLVELYELASRVVPALPLDRVIRCFGAVRPNPFYVEADGRAQARSISNFTVLEEDGLFSLIGIKTPGLTCAPGLGEYVAGKIAAWLGCGKKNPAFDPVRRGIRPVRDLPEEERAALIREKPEYGQLVCRCREVTLGEVREAIRRGAVSVDGVKRRTGAGMGRCQGGRCLQTVLEEVSRGTGVPVCAVEKDGGGSWMIVEENSETV